MHHTLITPFARTAYLRPLMNTRVEVFISNIHGIEIARLNYNRKKEQEVKWLRKNS